MASICRLGGKWRALIRRKGHKPISKRFLTKGAAEAWARHIEGAIDEGRAARDSDALTVADLIVKYRKLRDISRPIADTSNEHYMLKSLGAGLGAICAAGLTVDDLIGYATMRKDEGAGPYTINMDVSKLGTVFRYAGDGLPDVVGAARPKLAYLGLIGGGGKRERRPEQDELDRILAAMPQPYRDATEFAVFSAMRRGEVVALLWADLNRDKRTIVVRNRKHPRKKAGNDEVIPLLGRAWDILTAQPETEARVFPFHPQTWSKLFKRVCDALGIPDLHLHDMRHEGVSRMFEQGYAIQQVALVSGHKSWNQLRRYTNLKPESLHAHDRRQDAPPRPESQQSVSRRRGKS